MKASPFKLGRFNHLLSRTPDDILPLADKAEEAIKNSLKVTSKAAFVGAQKGTKRPHDDAAIKTMNAPKTWLNILDHTGHELKLGRVTHSDFEIMKGKMKNKSVVVVVPVPSDDETGETMNQYVRLKDLMSAYKYPFHIEQNGQSFFQVPMKITANNIGSLDGDAAFEIKVNSTTSAQQILLSYDDIVYGNVLLFGARNDVSIEKNFHQSFKRMEFFNVCHCIERLAAEFEYDSQQLTQLHYFFLSEQVATCRKELEEARKTIEIQKVANERLNQMLSTSQLQNSQSTSNLDDSSLYEEWESLTDYLRGSVDPVYYDCLKDSFSGFQAYNKRLIDPQVESNIAQRVEEKFPQLWSFIEQSIRTHYSKNKKTLSVLVNVFRMARQRDPRTMSSWAAINTINLLARGQKKAQIRPRVKPGECLSVESTNAMLSVFALEYHELIKTINQQYPTNVGSVDNFTKSFNSKNIRGAVGCKFLEATVRYTTRPRSAKVRVGSVFQKFELVDGQLRPSFVKVVDIISQDATHCSIIIHEQSGDEPEAVHLPLPNWKMHSITGNDDMDKPDTPSYTVNDIRSPLCLPNFDGLHQSSYLFQDPNHPVERTTTTVYNPKYYLNELRRTKNMADFRRYGNNIDDPKDFTLDCTDDADVRIYDETDSYALTTTTTMHADASLDLTSIHPTADVVEPPVTATSRSTKTASMLSHMFTDPRVRKQLLMAKQFQRRVVEKMDPWLDVVAEFLFMTMSEFKETESQEAILMTQQFLIHIGLLKENADGAISYADEFASLRRIIFGGDGLTNRNVAAVVYWLMHHRNDSRHESHAKLLQNSIQQFTFDIGHFHGHLHTLILIFALNYGGLIQPAQAQIGWKRSTKEPAISYYQSCEIARIVYVVIKRGLIVEFSRMLNQRGSNPIPLLDVDKHSDDTLLVEFPNTEEGWFSLHPRTVALLSARLFEEYLDDLRNKAADVKDQGLLLVLNYREAMNDHTLYVESVRLGDFLTPECILAEWLGAFVEGGKTMYTSSVLLMFDVISRSSDAELEELRLNRFLRVSEGKGCVALDELDEMINFLVKSLHLTDDVESSLQKTAFLSTFKQVKNHMDTRDGPHKNSTTPSLKEEYQAVYELLVRAELFKLKPNRKMERDTLWDALDESGLESILKNKKSRNEITEKEKVDSTSRLQNMLNHGRNQSSDESCQWQDIEDEATAAGANECDSFGDSRSAITSRVREKAARILAQACDSKRRCDANFGPMLTKGGLKGKTPKGVLSDKIQKSIKKHKESLEKREGLLALADKISAEFKASVGPAYDVDQQCLDENYKLRRDNADRQEVLRMVEAEQAAQDGSAQYY